MSCYLSSSYQIEAELESKKNAPPCAEPPQHQPPVEVKPVTKRRKGGRSKSVLDLSTSKKRRPVRTSLNMMNTSFCSSESSSSLTSASMTSSMTSSNSCHGDGHQAMSTSNSLQRCVSKGEGDSGGDSEASAAEPEQKSLTSLNREMRMLIRLATASPTDPLTAKYNGAGATADIHDNDR